MRLILIAALLVTPLLAERVDLEIDPAATKVQWTLGDVLHTVHGTFRVKTAALWFDMATGKAGGLLVVDATSGKSGSSMRDGRMNRNVLESAHYPEFRFLPDRVEGSDSDVQLHGTLTIHGGSHEVTMKVKSHAAQGSLTATASFSVPYVKWGMKDPSTFVLKVKDSVEIEVEAVARVK